MVIPDGTELACIFVFTYVVGLWSRRVLGGPALFLLFQHVVMWHTYSEKNPFDRAQDVGVWINIVHSVTAWLGGIAGVLQSHLLKGPRLLHYPTKRHRRRLVALNLVIAVGFISIPWVYVLSRTNLDVGVAVIPIPAVIFALVLTLTAWRIWKCEAMVLFFKHYRNIRWFAWTTGCVITIIILLFYVMDIFASSMHVELGFVLRFLIVVAMTLIIATLRVVAYKRIAYHDEIAISVQMTSVPSLWDWRDMLNSSGSEEDASNDNDSDFVDYGNLIN